MAGMIVPVIPTRTFDFVGIASNGSMDVVLKRKIDATEWLAASLIVKVEEQNLSSGSLPTMTIAAQLEGPTMEDPGTAFVSQTLLGSAVIQFGPIPPYTLVAPLGVALGSTFRVIVRATGPSAGIFSATFNVDVCLRNG